MIQVARQMRILGAIEAVDLRKYAPSTGYAGFYPISALRFNAASSEITESECRTPHNAFQMGVTTGGPREDYMGISKFLTGGHAMSPGRGVLFLKASPNWRRSVTLR